MDRRCQYRLCAVHFPVPELRRRGRRRQYCCHAYQNLEWMARFQDRTGTPYPRRRQTIPEDTLD